MSNIVCFFDKSIRSWVVFCTDKDGNQLWGADFYANKKSLELAWK